MNHPSDHDPIGPDSGNQPHGADIFDSELLTEDERLFGKSTETPLYLGEDPLQDGRLDDALAETERMLEDARAKAALAHEQYPQPPHQV